MSIIKNIIHKLLALINLRLERITNYFPVETDNYEKKIISTCLKFSMTNEIRMSALVGSFKHIFHNNIPGDFVECGVWRGGNLILLQKLQEKYSLNRKIFAYDTFSGMPNAGPNDYDDQNIHANFLQKLGFVFLLAWPSQDVSLLPLLPIEQGGLYVWI